MSSSSRMPASVAKSQSAFEFYRKLEMGNIKATIPANSPLGAVMTAVSQTWKSLPPVSKAKYEALAAKDKLRFQNESAAADAAAEQIQQARRDNLDKQEGEGMDREARGGMIEARVDRDNAAERRKEREAMIDPEILESRRLEKERKKEEADARRSVKAKKESLVKAKQDELKAVQKIDAKKRLEFLLTQSDVFSKLKKGGGSLEVGDEDEDEDMESNTSSSFSSSSKSKTKGSGKRSKSPPPPPGSSPSKRSSRNSKPAPGEEEEDPDEESGEILSVSLRTQPSTIVFGTMKQYQIEGLNWMIHLQDRGLNGILADEMGLGKTLQSISIMAYNFEYLRQNGPHLICVPKSTLSNWMNELNRWCPSLRAFRFHGNKEERQNQADTYLTNEAASDVGTRPSNTLADGTDDHSKSLRKFDVCVTTYEVANMEQKNLAKFAWQYLVIDEAHRLKNEASLFSKTVRSFQTKHRLLLTGTPLQNNLHELWALLNFLLPDIFSSAEQFDEWFDLDVDDDDAKKSMISTLHKILRPFMLRRLKADVAKNLPAKTETLLMVGMSKVQKELYKKLLIRDIDSLVMGDQVTKQGSRTSILNIIMQLRKCCGHPYLFEGIEDRTLNPMGDHVVNNCGKMVLTDKLLKKLKEKDHRVLIFTQMTRILDILEDVMNMRGYSYCRIDGNTTHEDRENSIDAFNAPNSPKFAFLLSTRAGGLGINLQTADTVILYDSDWNPQADLQAQDRAHRIGQKRPVQIYRLVTENTIEEKIVERAQQKLKLDAMVVQSGRLKDKDKVSKEELMAAVKFGADQVFRSTESDITDADIDAIMARGEEKTKELMEKLQNVDKGDLLDFSMDGGLSAQTYQGVDYSDRAFRDELKLLNAAGMGKRERKAVNNFAFEDFEKGSDEEDDERFGPGTVRTNSNRTVTVPRHFRLPKMEDFQFFNKKRLQELSKIEFAMFATMVDKRTVPTFDALNLLDSILPEEQAKEKKDLLAAGFRDWNKQNYFKWVKSVSTHGRNEFKLIANEMKMPVENIQRYTEAFFSLAKTRLGEREYKRVMKQVEIGDQKRAQSLTFSKRLGTFLKTFNDPRNEMVFINKGRDFYLEQDRALLTATHERGYSNWDTVRDALHADPTFTFTHAVQGISIDTLTKRADYRMRQLEREVNEVRKKMNLNNSSTGSKTQLMKAVATLKRASGDIANDEEMRQIDEILGKEDANEDVVPVKPNKLNEDSIWINQLHAIDKAFETTSKQSEEARRAILQGENVQLSRISLTQTLKETTANTGTLFTGAMQSLTAPVVVVKETKVNNGQKRGNPGKEQLEKKKIREEWWPELAMAIGAGGTNERVSIVQAFHVNHPHTVERQVNELYGQMTIRMKPKIIPAHAKPGNSRSKVWTYLRPHFYHLVTDPNALPEGWQGAKETDDAAWNDEIIAKESKRKAWTEKEKLRKKAKREGKSLDEVGLGAEPKKKKAKKGGNGVKVEEMVAVEAVVVEGGVVGGEGGVEVEVEVVAVETTAMELN